MEDHIEHLPIGKILDLADEPNLVPHLDYTLVQNEGSRAREGFEADEASMSDWLDKLKEIEALVKQEGEDKTYPFPGAANIKYPLITEAVLQFSARAYPMLINNGNIALAKVVGADEGGQKKRRADRVSKHMSYQLTEQMDNWDSEMDTLLMAVPQDGIAFKKVYFSEILGRNVSEFVPATDLIVSNATKTFKTCPRISHLISLYPYEIKEKVTLGEFTDEILEKYHDDGTQEPQSFVEQHTLIDLDGDGYPEPYILTYHEQTGVVCRIVADFTDEEINYSDKDEIISIEKRCYFVKYPCFPAADGSFYTPGFGSLLLQHNEAINATLNQMLDAGHLANTQSGFLSREFRVRGGSTRLSPGEFKKTDVSAPLLEQSIMLTPARDPSPVLFQLLGILIEGGKSIASIKDVMTGQGTANQGDTATLALIEQGMKVYSGIFKRMYRGLRDELRLIYNLNSDYLSAEAYTNVVDDPEASPEDYEKESFDILPAADPNMATDIQKNMRDQALLQLIQVPGMNVQAIITNHLEGLGIQDVERFILPPPPPPEPTPDDLAKLIKAQADKQKADNDTRDSFTLALERLHKMAVEDGDLGTALAELGILEIFKQTQLAEQSPQGAENDQQGTLPGPPGLPGLEGAQSMAMGPPNGAVGA